MSQTIGKVGGSFTAVGDRVVVTIPEGAQEAALSLYDEGRTIAIWLVFTEPPVTPLTTRFFTLISGPDLPPNFVKYIGSLLVDGADAHVIEISS